MIAKQDCWTKGGREIFSRKSWNKSEKREISSAFSYLAFRPTKIDGVKDIIPSPRVSFCGRRKQLEAPPHRCPLGNL